MRAAEIVSCIAFIQFLLGEASVIKYSRQRFQRLNGAAVLRAVLLFPCTMPPGASGVKRENVNGEKTGDGKRERRKGPSTDTGNVVHRVRKPHKARELAITRATRYTRHTGSARRKRDRHPNRQLSEAHSPSRAGLLRFRAPERVGISAQLDVCTSGTNRHNSVSNAPGQGEENGLHASHVSWNSAKRDNDSSWYRKSAAVTGTIPLLKERLFFQTWNSLIILLAPAERFKIIKVTGKDIFQGRSRFPKMVL